jgi:hypothetical protein
MNSQITKQSLAMAASNVVMQENILTNVISSVQFSAHYYCRDNIFHSPQDTS